MAPVVAERLEVARVALLPDGSAPPVDLSRALSCWRSLGYVIDHGTTIPQSPEAPTWRVWWAVRHEPAAGS